jgi:ATPase components of various ABC-type transport systems, contain duplicated ATPase
MIEIRNACYCYQASEKNNLSEVNLDVAPGEVVCLTGASGSGKTTLTRLVNGLIPHYYEGKLSGKIEVCGLTPSNHELWELAPKVGSVFQNPKTQFFCLDTTGELAFACENQGITPDKIRTRLKDVADALELTDLIDRSCLSLSGGEKQRVACGSATMLDPDVLVLDEPSSNLDFASIGLLRKIVAKWKAEGRTVLISEHRLHWLEGIADRIIVMRSGSVEREIDSKQFYASTADEARALGLRAPTFAAIAAEQCCARCEKNEFVEIRDMNYHYPQSSRGINVSRIAFRRGGVTAIIGSNGAGKSTFARCICGLVSGCKGTIDVGEGSGPFSSRPRNGYLVMQDVSHQLFQESVFDEVLASTRRADEHLTRTILASLDLTELAQRHPLSLSGGQMQRVALATALASGRDLLVLDEPTSGLDLAHMEQVAASVTAAAAEGRAVVVVTHDPEFIRACCTDFARMEDGSFVDQGALDNAGWSKVLSFFENTLQRNEEDWRHDGHC